MRVGAYYVRISNTQYEIDNNAWGTHMVEGGYGSTQINELSEKAKVSLEGIPTVDVPLKIWGSKLFNT